MTSEPIQTHIEVVPLSRLYSDMRMPFDPRCADQESFSILRPRRKSPIPPPLMQIGNFISPGKSDFEYSEITVAYFPNAVVTATGAVIVRDKYLIRETLEGSLDANGIATNLSAEDLKAVGFNEEVIINTNRLGMWNYSLFLLEVAPAVFLSSLIPGLEKLRAKIFFQPFMPELDVLNRKTVFELFGFGQDRLLITSEKMCRHRGVILFKLNDPHLSQRLSQMLSPVTASLQDVFASHLASTPRRIYVSRQGAASRKLANFDELNTKILSKHHIVPIQLEQLTIAEQVDLFTKADLVIAEHGAGLANVVFMRPGSFVVEIIPEPIAKRAVYNYVASHCRLNYCYATVPTVQGWQWDRDDVVAPLGLYDFLLDRI